MASDDNVNRDSCIYDPNFAIVCSFFKKFSSLCGIKHPNFTDLQQMLDSSDGVSPELIDLHIRLMRKAKKNVNPDRWQRTLAKFCYYYSPQDSWDLEQQGYENLDYKQRLRILLCACEAQFDQNIKFKNDVNKLPIDELRLSPIGKDKDGIKYWIHTDEQLDLRVYKENPEEETFDLIATDRDSLVKLIETLKTECDPDRKFEEPIEEDEEEEEEEEAEEEEENEVEEEQEPDEQIEEKIDPQPDIKNEPNPVETRSPQTQSKSNEAPGKESHSEAVSAQSSAQPLQKLPPVKQIETPPETSKIKKHVDVKTNRFDKPPEIVLKKEKVVDKTPKTIKPEEFAQHIEKLKSEKMLLPLLSSPLPFEPIKSNGKETLKTKINMKFNMIKPVLQNEVLMSKIEEVKNHKDLYKKVVVKRDENPINSYVMQINKSKEAAGKVGKPGLKLEQILKSKLAQKLAAHEPSDSKAESSNNSSKSNAVEPSKPAHGEKVESPAQTSQPNTPAAVQNEATKRKLSVEQVEAKKLKLDDPTAPTDQVEPDDEDRVIEEPLMLVTGVGSGKDCQANPYDEDSEDEREFTLFITGTGCGHDCYTGNNETEESDKEKHPALTHKVEDILSKNELDESASTSDGPKKPEEEKKKPKLWTIDAICNSDSKESKKDDVSCFPNYSFNKDKKSEPYREYSFFGMPVESKENDVVPTNFYFGCDTQNPPFIGEVRNLAGFKEKKTHNVKDIVQLDSQKQQNDVNYSFTNSKPQEAFNLCMRENTASPVKQNNTEESRNYSKPSDNVFSNIMNLSTSTSVSSETQVAQKQNDSENVKTDTPITNSFASLVPYDDDDETSDSIVESNKHANDKIKQTDDENISPSTCDSNMADFTPENRVPHNITQPSDKQEIAEDLSRSDHVAEVTEKASPNEANDTVPEKLSQNDKPVENLSHDQAHKVTKDLSPSDQVTAHPSKAYQNDGVAEDLSQNDKMAEDLSRNDQNNETTEHLSSGDKVAEDLSQNDKKVNSTKNPSPTDNSDEGLSQNDQSIKVTQDWSQSAKNDRMFENLPRNDKSDKAAENSSQNDEVAEDLSQNDRSDKVTGNLTRNDQNNKIAQELSSSDKVTDVLKQNDQSDKVTKDLSRNDHSDKVAENLSQNDHSDKVAKNLSQNDHSDEVAEDLSQNDPNSKATEGLSRNKRSDKVSKHLSHNDKVAGDLQRNNQSDRIVEDPLRHRQSDKIGGNLSQKDQNDEVAEDLSPNDRSDKVAKTLSQSDKVAKDLSQNDKVAENLPQTDHSDEASKDTSQNDKVSENLSQSDHSDKVAEDLSPSDRGNIVAKDLSQSDKVAKNVSQSDRGNKVAENLSQSDRVDNVAEDLSRNDEQQNDVAEDLSQNDLDRESPSKIDVEEHSKSDLPSEPVEGNSLITNQQESLLDVISSSAKEITSTPQEKETAPKNDSTNTTSELPVIEKINDKDALSEKSTNEEDVAESNINEENIIAEPPPSPEPVKDTEIKDASNIEPKAPSSFQQSEQSQLGVAAEVESDNCKSIIEDSTISQIQPEPIRSQAEQQGSLVEQSVTEKLIPLSQQSQPKDEKVAEECEVEKPPIESEVDEPSKSKVEKPEPDTSSQVIDSSTAVLKDAPAVESSPSKPVEIDIADRTQWKCESDVKQSTIEETPCAITPDTETTTQVPSEEHEQSNSASVESDQKLEQMDEQKPCSENVFSDDDVGPTDAPSPEHSSEDEAKTEQPDKHPETPDKLKKSKKSKAPETTSTPAITLRSSARVTRSLKKEEPSPKKTSRKQSKEAKVEPKQTSKKTKGKIVEEPVKTLKSKTLEEPVKPPKSKIVEEEPVKTAKSKIAEEEPVKTPKKRGRKKGSKLSKTPVKIPTPKTQSEASSGDESNDEADSENQKVKNTTVKLKIKKIEKKSEDEESQNDAKIENENDKKSEKPAKDASTKKKAKRGWLNEIDVSNIESPTSTPIRQSRRIAQLKIKEQAEGKYIDQITPTKKSSKAESKSKQVSAKKNNKTPTKKTSKTKMESDGEDSNYEKSSSKKKRKKKDQKKKFKVGTPWKAGSDSSTEEDAEEEDHFEDEEEDEDIIINDASDHEFSPESDLEDEDFQPVKRARTAHSKPKTEDKAEKDDLCCQKCRTAEQPEWILLCDKCDEGWHAACLRPPLMTIPEGDWYCPPCQHNMLISSLHKFLKSYDKDVKKRDNEVLRKKRLEYVGISFSNIISEQQKGDKSDSKVKKEDEAFVKYDISEDDNTEEESEEEPLYTLRVRRQANVSYRLNEYDELMNSAIQTENGELVEETGHNVGPETEPKAEEAQVSEKPTEAVESVKSSEEKAEKDDSSEDEEEDETEKPKEEKVSPMILQLKGIRKKPARLTKLDVSSDDDHYSDEDFKGSSADDDDEDEYAKSETDSDEGRYRKSNRGPVRRSTRARVTRYDNDFINDDDSEEDEYEPKKKKKRSRNSDSDSEEEDSTWGKRKRSKYSRAHRSSSSKKRRKRIVFDGDSDEEKKERKEKKAKKSRVRVTYGLEESEDDHPQRRTRGKKINYLENLGTDSEEETAKAISKSKKIVSDDDDYVNEDEEPGIEEVVNENGEDHNAQSKKVPDDQADALTEKSNEVTNSSSSLHELIAANNTSVIRTYSKSGTGENARNQKPASALENAVPEVGVESDASDVPAPDKGKKSKKSPKKDVQMYSTMKSDNKLILKKVDPTNASLEGMQSMAQSIPQMSNYSVSMVRKMMPPMAGDGQFTNIGGLPSGTPPSYSEVGIVYEDAEGQMGPEGDKYTHPLRVVSPNKLYGQDGQQMPPMLGRPAPPFMMGPGMPPRPMPPNMMPRGVMPMPPGMHMRGLPPPNAMPPGGMPPGGMPPGGMPAGGIPANAMPPGGMPHGAMAPGVPPNSMPPSAMPGNQIPPNVMPPSTMAPNVMPPMSQAPITTVSSAVPVSPNSMMESNADSPKRRPRGRGKKQLEIERMKRESVPQDEMIPLHMLKPLPGDMNVVRPPPTSSFNSPSPPTSFANYPNVPRLPYPAAGPPPSTAPPPTTQSAVTVSVGNPSKRVKITPTRMRQPNPGQNMMRFARPPSMMHGAGHLPLDPSPSGGSAVPISNSDNSMPPQSRPPPSGTPPHTEAGALKKESAEQYYQATSYAPTSQVPRTFNPRPEFAFAQKPLPHSMYPQPIPSTGATSASSRPVTVTTNTVIAGPISSQAPAPPSSIATSYAMTTPSTISSSTAKPPSTVTVTAPTSAYQALHIKQLPTAQSSASSAPYSAPPYYAAAPVVPNSYPQSQPSLPPASSAYTTPPFSRVASSTQPPQPLSTTSSSISFSASSATTTASSTEYVPTTVTASSSDSGFQFQECNTTVTSSNDGESGTQFQAAGYEEENNATEEQPSGEFGGLVSYFSSQREDDLDA